MANENLASADIVSWLTERVVTLINVREPDEYAVERFHGALLYPLSTFNPKTLPDIDPRKLVLQCGSGMRSVKPMAACPASGVEIAGHLAGGLRAWKEAGLPVITTDSETGQLRETR